MLKRSLVVLSLTLAMVISAVPIRPVQGVLMTPAEVAMLDAASQDAKDNQSKSGNGFVRVLKAPFKAIGRIFGIGGDKDDSKTQRLSRKDVKKFESVGTARVVDARTTGFESKPAAEPAENAVPTNPALAAPQENLERGRAFLNSGNVNDAIAALSTAASTDPKFHEAYNLLGV